MRGVVTWDSCILDCGWNFFSKESYCSCVQCRKFKGNVIQQQMASMAVDRAHVNQSPFTVTGCDVLDHFMSSEEGHR